MSHQVRVRNQYARRFVVRAEHAHWFAGLHQKGFIVAQHLELTHDGVKRRPVPRGFSRSTVDHQVLRTLGHFGIQIIHEHAQCGFLFPSLAMKRGSAWCANLSLRRNFQG